MGRLYLKITQEQLPWTSCFLKEVMQNKKYLLKLFSTAVAGLSLSLSLLASTAPAPIQPIPDTNQLIWQQREQYMFLHFGVNTFTDREWGEGTESPSVFNPSDFNAKQWAKAAKDAGFKMLILTAKHHDGFCLWPSAYTEHSVKNSPWKDGKGDVVKEVSEACKEVGLDFGVYLSPWDRNSRFYGDSPKYNEYYKNQLRELLTQYGKISMVWWDGACGEGPNGKRQEYDWDAYLKIVRELAPDAVIFSDRGDVRWVGNEDGLAQETCWSLYDPSSVAIGGGTQKQMGEGNPVGNAWAPAECDVSIRPGWFYHSEEDSKVKTLSHLLDIYYRSVGHNCCLHLNVPPDRRGLLHENDVARLKEFNHAIKENFKTNLAANKQYSASAVRGNSSQFSAANIADGKRQTYWSLDDGQTQGAIEIDLGVPTTFDLVLLQEYIELGQRISGYHLDAWDSEKSAWKEIAKGTTIGYKWILRVPETTAQKVRLVIESARACPTLSSFELYKSSYK